MFLGKFLGTLDENKGKVYYVVKSDFEKTAIMIANKFLKTKKDTLKCVRVYLSNKNSDEFSFESNGLDGEVKAWAVYR